MKKGYMVYKSYPTWDDSDDVCMFLNIEKGKEYVKKMNEPRNEEIRLLEMCKKCAGDNDEEKQYKFKDTCQRCKMGKDRYGVYCENEIESHYQLEHPMYFGREVEIEE